VFNLIAKKFVSHPSMESIVKGNKTLVNYFTTAGFWRENISTWQKANEIKHGLQTLCETRWYSMSRVCLGVQSHEVGFQKCIELLQDPNVDTPSIPQPVIRIIEDRDHFTSNQTLINLLKPVVDAIANLERSETTLADIWKELLNAYKKICDVDVYSRFEPFKRHCIDVLHAQTKVFHEDIYVIAFFLHPSYRRVAVSKKHSICDIGQKILHLAKNWKFTRAEASTLQDSINRYYNSVYPFNSKSVDNPLNYWLTVPLTTESESLKKLLIHILEIVPHAAGVEGLFSMMNAMKTKARNRMSPSTLKMMAQIKLHLLQGDRVLAHRNSTKKKSPQRNDSEYENMKAYDSFISPGDLDTFEEGVFTNEQTLVETSRQDAFLETIFDFDLLKTSPPQPDNDVIVIQDTENPAAKTNWDPSELWASNLES
jgi:hypothetical protein